MWRMSMMENEAKRPKVAIVGGGRNAGRTLKAHIDILEELQAYRAIGTVEELKALKNKHIGKDNMVISSSDLMTILNSDEKEIRAKAIDELVEEAMKRFTEKDIEDDYASVTDCKVILRDIAEQLKGGA